MDRQKILALLRGVSIKYWLILYGVLLLAVAMLLSSLVLYPQEARVRDLERQLQAERQKVAVVESFTLAHPEIEQYLQEMQRSQTRNEQLLPGNLDVSKYIAQLEKDARDSAVRLVSVKPSAAVEKAGYREIPMEVMAEGSFYSIMTFLKRLEDGERFCAPTAFLLQPKGAVLSAKLNLQIFAYGNTPKQAAAPAAAAPGALMKAIEAK